MTKRSTVKRIPAQKSRYAMCIKNRGYPTSLDVRKVYRVLPDSSAERSRMVRVIDETGEDYLYPAAYFRFVELPRDALRVFSRKSACPPRRTTGPAAPIAAKPAYNDLARVSAPASRATRTLSVPDGLPCNAD